MGFVSGAAGDPKSVPSQLAQALPRAADYFMSYVLVKALSGAASALLQPVALFGQIVSRLQDVTPRQKWRRQAELSRIEWARIFPPLTNIAVIGIAFSVIAPLVLVVVSFAFALYWFVHRYNVLYVYQYDHESSGRFFVAAFNQLFTGLYVMQLCLIGHFFMATGADGRAACVPQGITMTAVLGLTVAYQLFVNRSFQSLIDYLPVFEHEEASDDGSPRRNSRGTTDNDACGYKSQPSSDVKQARRSFLLESQCHGAARRASGRFGSTAATDDLSKGRGRLSVSKVEESISDTMRSYGCNREPIVWIPRDPLGFSTGEIQDATMNVSHINVSDEGAWIDEKGEVSIESCPPDREARLHMSFALVGRRRGGNGPEDSRG